MDMRLDLAIYKARMAARESGNIRAHKNHVIQEAASAAECHARAMLRNQIGMKILTIAGWDEELEAAQDEYNVLRRKEEEAGKMSNRVLQFDCSFAAYKVDQICARREEAVLLAGDMLK